ncbi:hypothetical protein MJO55_15825 [Mycolicibacterium rufum]|uniref:Uncharacterized protein n=1 Tax=Mycolicibacterium rufum TaxID=318424 RepID=A0A9X2YEN3_9MYCO|nr:hypothetical protein [Mycolicibacterium rufum]KGI68654.1 hypothetical protein EU78_15845 [Mycolicibacterium rufum]MCV7071910.1 hypothetical protein [Mycolicibacterium rufum]ULP34800.1 hypothetical protein MJO55_15825 [Mycolicibacterium rufum]
MTTLRGKRYGEVLLVTVGPDGPQATVYNTYPLNDCPDDLWSRLDADTLARQHDAVAALLNGPRYWLMDAIEKDMGADREIATFGGLDMYRQAVVTLSSMNPAPYVANTVARNAVFVFDAGQPVFELLDPEGGQWVMQTWSQIVDPALGYDDLPHLADRLTLPDGWSYRARTLAEPLRIDTSSQAAQVLQDDLTNSYSLVSG